MSMQVEDYGERIVLMRPRISVLIIAVMFKSIVVLAAVPQAVDDLHLTAENTSRICYPLMNDIDSDGDALFVQSFEGLLYII